MPRADGFTAVRSPSITKRWNASFVKGDRFGVPKSRSKLVSFSVNSNCGSLPGAACPAASRSRSHDSRWCPNSAWLACTVSDEIAAISGRG